VEHTPFYSRHAQITDRDILVRVLKPSDGAI
jgi:hypothetical protein